MITSNNNNNKFIFKNNKYLFFKKHINNILKVFEPFLTYSLFFK